MYYTDDPVADYERYSADQERELDRLPRCSECGEAIQTEHCYEVNDELICPGCMIKNHRKAVDDIVC